MPNPVFFVQNNYVMPLTIPVATFARARGIALEDRSASSAFDPDDCGIDWGQYDVVLPYGSIQFVRQLKSSTLAKFILHDELRFSTSAWVPRFGSDALNGAGRQASALEVADLLRVGSYHLRPATIDKAFPGAVYDAVQWRNVRNERALPDDLLCWVAPVQLIQNEWRCWIVGNQVVEISKYREDGEMCVQRESSHEVMAAAQGFADRYLPAPCVVLDIALVDGAYKLIEFNPIHSSGWYKAEVGTVLDAWLEWTIKASHSLASRSTARRLSR